MDILGCSKFAISISANSSNQIKMAVDDIYKAYDDKGVITDPIDYNDFESVNNKLRVKGSSIELASKITGRPLAI